MDKKLYLHLATAGLTTLVVGAIVLFWSYPKLLVYVLLAIVAALSYGALYLILAARLDPEKQAKALADEEATPVATPDGDATAELSGQAEAAPMTTAPRRKATVKAKTSKRAKAATGSPPAEPNEE